MAYKITAGAGNERVEYGTSSTGITGATALTVAITLKLDAATSDDRICGKWGSAPTTKWSWLLAATDTDEIGFVIGDASSLYGPKTTGINMASGSTYRIVARVYDLNTSRAGDIYVNGSLATTTGWFTDAVTSISNTTTSQTFVGYETDESAAQESGDYSEFAIWTAKLPDADCIAYGNGFSPDLLSRTGRWLYAPMIRGLNDKWGGKTGSATGGSVASHPRVIYPRRKQVVVASAAATTTFGFLRDNAGVGVMGGGPFSRANAGLGVLA